MKLSKWKFLTALVLGVALTLPRPAAAQCSCSAQLACGAYCAVDTDVPGTTCFCVTDSTRVCCYVYNYGTGELFGACSDCFSS